MNKLTSLLLCVLAGFALQACTYSVTLAHSEGSSDVVDETQDNKPQGSLSLPSRL